MISSDEVKRIKQSVKDKMIRYGFAGVSGGTSGSGRSKPPNRQTAKQTEGLGEDWGSWLPREMGVIEGPMGPIREGCNGGRSDGTKPGGEEGGMRAVPRRGRGRTECVEVSRPDPGAPSRSLPIRTGPPAENGRRSAKPPVTMGLPPPVSGPISGEGWRRGPEGTGLVVIDPKWPLVERQVCGLTRSPPEHIGFGPLTLPPSGRQDGTDGGRESRSSGVGESGPAGDQPAVIPDTRFHNRPALPATTMQPSCNQDPAKDPGGYQGPEPEAEKGTKAWKQEEKGGMNEAKILSPLGVMVKVSNLKLSRPGCPPGVPIGQGQVVDSNDPMEMVDGQSDHVGEGRKLLSLSQEQPGAPGHRPILPKKREATVMNRGGWRERKRNEGAGWTELGLKTGLGISSRLADSSGNESETAQLGQQYSPFDRGKTGWNGMDLEGSQRTYMGLGGSMGAWEDL